MARIVDDLARATELIRTFATDGWERTMDSADRDALVWMLDTLPAALTFPIFRRAIVAGRGGKRPSLHIDLARGRARSEVEYLNGALVHAGQRMNIPTPVNSVLYETLTGITRHEIEWTKYQGRGERLAHDALQDALVS